MARLFSPSFAMRTLPILLCTSFFLAACAPAASPGNVDEPTPASAMSARTITIAANNFAFTPNMITVKKGEKVTLSLVGQSGIHGIGIPELGINQKIDLGQTVSIELPTDAAGSYAFKCNVPCGSGHKEMTGTIVIEN